MEREEVMLNENTIVSPLQEEPQNIDGPSNNFIDFFNKEMQNGRVKIIFGVSDLRTLEPRNFKSICRHLKKILTTKNRIN